eukprot:gb/GECG01000679.1/.p1 GENE.gb/GECG01000679.1/~~gb/GECG01000679.1/.p1  ORF type:complete len:635 (+),score=160.46 gb/GECG01000679.1/:1-1905(+)
MPPNTSYCRKKHQRVVGVDDQGKFTSIPVEEMAKSAQPRKEGKAISTIDEMGFPLDGYDYHQHLRGREPGGVKPRSQQNYTEDSTVITADGEVVSTQDQFDHSVNDSASGAAAASSSQSRRRVTLPADVLPTDEEVDREEMLESITVSGKSLPPAIYHALEEWDPDSERIDDEEEGGDQEYEELNDDFIMHATGEKEIPEEWLNEEQEDDLEIDNGGIIGDFGIPGFDYDAHIAKLMAKAEEEDRQGGAVSDERGEEVEPSADTTEAAERNQLDSYLDVVLAQYDDMYIGEGVDDDEEDSEESEKCEGEELEEQDEERNDDDDFDEEHTGSVKSRGFQIGEYVPGYGRVVGAAFAENKTSRMTADKDDEVALAEKEAVDSAIEEFKNTKVDATAVIEEGREVTQQLSRVNNAGGNEIVAPYGWGEQDHSEEKDKEQLKALEAMFLQKKSKPKWDAETVVSTYSNLDNHPKIVNSKTKSLLKPQKLEEESAEEPVAATVESRNDNGEPPAATAAFKVSIPPSGGGTLQYASEKSAQEEAPSNRDSFNQPTDEAAEESTESNDDRIEASIPVRNPKETREEKRYRKQLAKEQRRRRRQEKKELKKAFKSEEERQTRQQIGESKAAGVPAGTSVFGV